MLTACRRLINLAVGPPGVKFKQSAMPFVQMENISHFLRACQQPPLGLQQHDMFLTVDLYESKDPTQVLQCLGAFSRAAHNVNPSAFPSSIGRSGRSHLSPQNTGPATSPRGRGISSTSNGSSVYNNRPALAASKTGDSNSGRWSPTKSPTKSPTSVSSWSKKEQEGTTAPAWSIAQYGYMGGASQGNLGISFGGRRQITSAGPHVPSLAEKEKLRKQKEAEEELQRQQMEEEQRRRKAELEAEEERARLEEERRWAEETRRQRAEEKRKAEDEKRRWEEEERQWRLTEEKRRKDEEEAEARLAQERQRSRAKSDARLRGQFLSQYQAEQQEEKPDPYSRVKELEKELELARQREQEYERERQGRPERSERSERSERPERPEPSDRSRTKTTADAKERARSRSRPARPPSRQDSWSRDEREYLRTQWGQQQSPQHYAPPPESRDPRPLPDPRAPAPPPRISSNKTGEYSPTKVNTHRTGDESPPKSPFKVKTHRTGDGPRKLQKQRTGESSPTKVKTHNTGGSSRPLPDPTAYASTPPAAHHVGPPLTHQTQNRTDRFLASNQAPQQHFAPQTYARELSATAERDGEDRRRQQAQQATKAGGWAGKSLLEREMEMERQRQREWEESQKETARAPRNPEGVDGIGGGIGGRWDVGQWSGYTGGDNQNRGGQGIGAGRRQIAGPRPLPGQGGR